MSQLPKTVTINLKELKPLSIIKMHYTLKLIDNLSKPDVPKEIDPNKETKKEIIKRKKSEVKDCGKSFLSLIGLQVKK